MLTSYVLGRTRTRVLANENMTFCRISDVVKAGYLDKRGSWFKSFKRRYFVLRDDVSVSYYEAEQSLDTLLGSLYLRPETTITIIDPPKSVSAANFVEDRRIFIHCEDTVLHRDALS